MKRALLFALLCTGSGYAQINGDYLDINNVKSYVNSRGDLFNKPGGFEAPQGSGKTTIKAGNLWFGGYDNGGNLKMAAQTYGVSGSDFWPGPLDLTGAIDTAYSDSMNLVWKLSKCDIDAYSNWMSSGAIGPNPVSPAAMVAIDGWPSVDQDGEPLAPFLDINGNGVYEPGFGEVPAIKGDQAIFFVYNDKRNIHTATGSAAIGLQVQGMMYAYSCIGNTALYNTIFTDYKIINESSFTLDSFFIGNWTDFNIGDSADDYVGCDVARNMYYGYNGAASDSQYGSTPPYQGVLMLRGPYADPNGSDDSSPYPQNITLGYNDGIIDNEQKLMSTFGYYGDGAYFAGTPNYAPDYYTYMTGEWLDGTPWQYGGDGHLSGGTETKYLYPDNSDPVGIGTSGIPQSPWTEVSASTTPGDRRAIGSYGPVKLLPGSIEHLEFAYVFAKATTGGSSASHTLLNTYADYIRANFDNPNLSCGCDGISAVQNTEEEFGWNIYPNPAANSISISISDIGKEIMITVTDVSGRIVKQLSSSSRLTSINVEELSKGIYFLNVNNGKNIAVKKFIKN